MKVLFPITLLILTLVSAAEVLAHSNESCVLSRDESLSVCHHYFEGMTIDLPVKGEFSAKCEGLVVRILQQQGALFVPLREPLAYDQQICSTLKRISIELPDIRVETDLLIQIFQTERKSGQSNVPDEPVEVIALRVYPDTILDPLKHLAEENSIVVYDDGGMLIDFFEYHEVDFITGFGSLFGTPIGLFVDNKDPERLLEDSSIKAAVIFREKIIDVPQVRTISSNGQIRVYVEMNLLQDLHSSPLTQKALMKIINLAINPNPSNRG